MTAPVLLAVLYGFYAVMALFQDEVSEAMERLLNVISGLLAMFENEILWYVPPTLLLINAPSEDDRHMT